jgi:hypothetical protein
MRSHKESAIFAGFVQGASQVYDSGTFFSFFCSLSNGFWQWASNSTIVQQVEGNVGMQDRPESKEEMVERLTRQFRELLEKKLPEEPGTLEEIERVTEEIGAEIKREIEDECLDWHGSGYLGAQITCSCGHVSKFRNYHPKRIVSLCGETTIRRAYYHCSSCGTGYVPLDAKLDLDSECTSIGVRTKVARLAAWIPFGDVSLELRELCGIHISSNTAWRIAESVGQRIKQERSERERVVVSGHAQVPSVVPGRLYVGIDGVHVPMYDGSYHEAKIGIVYQTQERDGNVSIRDARYMATLERTDAFGERVYALAFDCGVENANDVACLGDGAAWIWNSFSHHYPDAVQILDYYHACEHLDEVAKTWYGEENDKAKCWLEARKSDLLSDCVETVIRSIRSWHPADDEARITRRRELGYFQKNRDRMRYATLKANGYHIGSGLVESACKTVVTQRLKQSGMRWSEPGAECMVHLRSFLLSDRSADISRFARAA